MVRFMATNITEFKKEDILNKIDNLRSIKYNYINDDSMTPYIGFIAQDLIKYGFNNMVTYIDENNSEYESYKYLIEDQESPEHIKLSVSYNDIIPILTRNIQII